MTNPPPGSAPAPGNSREEAHVPGNVALAEREALLGGPAVAAAENTPTLPEPPVPTLRSSFLGRVALHLLGATGARLGLAWIGAMVFLAVFAPVIASSHPFLWKVDGEVSSPWLRHLTGTDVVLLLGFVAAAVLALLRRLPLGWRVAGWVWVTAAAAAAVVVAAVMDQVRSFDGGFPLQLIMLVGFLLTLLAVLVVLPLTSAASTRFKAAVGVVGLLLAGVLLGVDPRPPSNVVYSQYREAAAEGRVDWQLTPPLAYSPNDYQRDARSATGLDPRVQTPSLAHPLGTDESGADVASRMIHATRIALAIGLIATGIALAIGITLGGLMGYFAGWVDLLGMRLVEVFSAIPVIFLLIMIVAFYGRNLYLMMLVIGLTGWVGYAIFIRAEFLKLRSMDYVAAARATGAPLTSILFKHMLPNGVTPVLVLASFGIASAILTESTLSFLGLGLVEEPSWGQMLNQARRAIHQWGLTVFPGLAIFFTVFAYNLIGEALRDALDPKVAGGE